MYPISRIALLMLVSLFSAALCAETLHGPTTISDRNFSDLTIMGPATLSNVQADTLNVYGTLTARELTIKNSMQVKGPAICEKSTVANAKIFGPATFSDMKFETLIINGPLEGNLLTVSKTLEIRGPLIVEESQLGQVIVTSEMILLKKSQIGSILVKRDTADFQILTLTEDSVVNNDVTFESGKGRIVMDKGSKINGKTTGAKTEVSS